MHVMLVVMLFITQLLFVLAGWSVSSFYHISVTVQNRTHVHVNFLLRITHTIISQSTTDSSWITLYLVSVRGRPLPKILFFVWIFTTTCWWPCKSVEIYCSKCNEQMIFIVLCFSDHVIDLNSKSCHQLFFPRPRTISSPNLLFLNGIFTSPHVETTPLLLTFAF